ncbi:hypothetical protein EYF80_040732 [Liparis tanakae]|uniref:Uncharacterized protein n=1 Tax=Liparis tanakae TaxID=230148 RepID=A0A4Z2G7I8_9TELE|nr:hypothetical protein EYF80_040732 [Liparis tanakae]
MPARLRPSGEKNDRGFTELLSAVDWNRDQSRFDLLNSVSQNTIEEEEEEEEMEVFVAAPCVLVPQI